MSIDIAVGRPCLPAQKWENSVRLMAASTNLSPHTPLLYASMVSAFLTSGCKSKAMVEAYQFQKSAAFQPVLREVASDHQRLH